MGKLTNPGHSPAYHLLSRDTASGRTLTHSQFSVEPRPLSFKRQWATSRIGNTALSALGSAVAPYLLLSRQKAVGILRGASSLSLKWKWASSRIGNTALSALGSACYLGAPYLSPSRCTALGRTLMDRGYSVEPHPCHSLRHALQWAMGSSLLAAAVWTFARSTSAYLHAFQLVFRSVPACLDFVCIPV